MVANGHQWPALAVPIGRIQTGSMHAPEVLRKYRKERSFAASSHGTCGAALAAVEHAHWIDDRGEAAQSGCRPAARGPLRLGRYVVSEPIAHGGMASVHLSVVAGDRAHVYALKRIHPHLAFDDYYKRMLLDENAIGAAVQHPNVIATYGGEMVDGEMFLVMEYVVGASLSELQRAWKGPMPPHYAATIIAGVLRGLDAAHEARGSRGESLRIVHRDVSPQNIMVGVDGVPRVFDFGVATATRRAQSTRTGALKGKLAYMAPEQVLQTSLDRRLDVYAAGVVLWEALTGRALFQEDNDAATLARVLQGEIPRPSSIQEHIPRALDTIVLRALARDPDRRYGTAREMAEALEGASRPVAPAELGQWVAELAGASLAKQDAIRRDLVGEPRACAPPSFDDSATSIRELWAPPSSGFRVEEAASERDRPVGDIALVFALVLSSGLAGALAMHLAHVWHVWNSWR